MSGVALLFSSPLPSFLSATSPSLDQQVQRGRHGGPAGGPSRQRPARRLQTAVPVAPDNPAVPFLVPGSRHPAKKEVVWIVKPRDNGGNSRDRPAAPSFPAPTPLNPTRTQKQRS